MSPFHFVSPGPFRYTRYSFAPAAAFHFTVMPSLPAVAPINVTSAGVVGVGVGLVKVALTPVSSKPGLRVLPSLPMPRTV